jgi:hypothetical protein
MSEPGPVIALVEQRLRQDIAVAQSFIEHQDRRALAAWLFILKDTLTDGADLLASLGMQIQELKKELQKDQATRVAPGATTPSTGSTAASGPTPR